MIKICVVCDRCRKEKPYIIIRDSKGLGKNVVMCKRCAEYYYDLSHDGLKCASCGRLLSGDIVKSNSSHFCSLECAVRNIEHCTVGIYTQEHEQELLESIEREKKP